MNHLVSNMKACEEGPLDERKIYLIVLLNKCGFSLFISSPGVVKAFDEAWLLDKGNCAKYYR